MVCQLYNIPLLFKAFYRVHLLYSAPVFVSFVFMYSEGFLLPSPLAERECQSNIPNMLSLSYRLLVSVVTNELITDLEGPLFVIRRAGGDTLGVNASSKPSGYFHPPVIAARVNLGEGPHLRSRGDQGGRHIRSFDHNPNGPLADRFHLYPTSNYLLSFFGCDALSFSPWCT